MRMLWSEEAPAGGPVGGAREEREGRGPADLASPAALADFAACAEAIRHGSHSFHAAGRFLPTRLRRPAHAIYAFCRLADDAVDLTTGDRAEAVARLSERLDRVMTAARRRRPRTGRSRAPSGPSTCRAPCRRR